MPILSQILNNQSRLQEVDSWEEAFLSEFAAFCAMRRLENPENYPMISFITMKEMLWAETKKFIEDVHNPYQEILGDLWWKENVG
jgi:hypothetical protein